MFSSRRSIPQKGLYIEFPSHGDFDTSRNLYPAIAERCIFSVHLLVNERAIGTTLHQEAVVMRSFSQSFKCGRMKIRIVKFELNEMLVIVVEHICVRFNLPSLKRTLCDWFELWRHSQQLHPQDTPQPESSNCSMENVWAIKRWILQLRLRSRPLMFQIVGNRGVGNLRLIGLVGLGPASRVFTFHLLRNIRAPHFRSSFA